MSGMYRSAEVQYFGLNSERQRRQDNNTKTLTTRYRAIRDGSLHLNSCQYKQVVRNRLATAQQILTQNVDIKNE